MPKLDFQQLLELSVKAHGHLCPGQILGVRLAMLGLSYLGYEAPLDDREIKKVVVVVEIDRCAADAVATVTGVRLGRRSLKFHDYGLMAATFVNLPDNRAVRVAVREDCRDKTVAYAPQHPDPSTREIEAYKIMPASELFTVQEVEVSLKPEDLPGYHESKAVCDECGSVIRHRREIHREGRTLCQVCAGGAYFRTIRNLERVDNLDPAKPSRRD